MKNNSFMLNWLNDSKSKFNNIHIIFQNIVARGRIGKIPNFMLNLLEESERVNTKILIFHNISRTIGKITIVVLLNWLNDSVRENNWEKNMISF